MRGRATALVCALVAAVCACSKQEVQDPVPAVKPAAQAPKPDVKGLPPEDGWALVRVKIVDLQGNPLPYAVPIATSQPNAFEKPEIMGDPADDKGEAAFYIPPDKRLYIRAWDFSLQMFANNYYDVYPGPVMEKGIMTLVMVPGATLRGQVVLPDGQPPAVGTQVAVMMYHPNHGPWWPAEAQCDDKGVVVFPKVPAGIFSLKLKLQSGASADLSSVTLHPNGFQDVGKLAFK